MNWWSRWHRHNHILLHKHTAKRLPVRATVCMVHTCWFSPPQSVWVSQTHEQSDTRTIRHTDTQTSPCHCVTWSLWLATISFQWSNSLPLANMKDPKITLPIILSEKENQKKFWILFDRNPPKKETFVDILFHFQTPLLFFLPTHILETRLTFMTTGMLHDG